MKSRYCHYMHYSGLNEILFLFRIKHILLSEGYCCDQSQPFTPDTSFRNMSIIFSLIINAL